MLELGDEPCLGLEVAHERRLVDEIGPDNLDRDLSADRRLVCAIDDAEVADAYLLAELVPADGAAECIGRDRRRQPVDPEGREVGRLSVEQQLEDVLLTADALETKLTQRLRPPAGLRGR